MSERSIGDRHRSKAGRCIWVFARRRDRSRQIVEGGFTDGGDEGRTAGDALVERGCPHADALSDGLHGDRLEPAGLEQRTAGGDDLVGRRSCPGWAHAFARPIRPRWVSWNELDSLRP